MDVTWRHIAVYDPELVAWAVARFGPLPDGSVVQADYDRIVEAYSKENT